MEERKFQIFLLEGKTKHNVKHKGEFTWDEFTNMFKEGDLGTPAPLVRQVNAPYSKTNADKNKDGMLVVAGALKEGLTYHNGENMFSRSMLALDIEKQKNENVPENIVEIIDSLGYDYIMYSTINDTLEDRRFRVFLPLDKDITEPVKFKRISMQIMGKVGAQYFDGTCNQFDRMMYVPVSFSDKPAEIHIKSDGNCINVDEMWSKILADASTIPILEDEKNSPKEDPTKRTDIIGSFCRCFNCYEAIELLNKSEEKVIYEYSGFDERYTYYPAFLEGHSADALKILNKGLFAYSHQVSDPIAKEGSDGIKHSVNAYELVRIHKFGHLKKEEESKKKMEEFALNIPDVASDFEINGYKPNTDGIELINSDRTLEAPLSEGSIMRYVADSIDTDTVDYLYDSRSDEWRHWDGRNWEHISWTEVSRFLIRPELLELQGNVRKAKDRKDIEKHIVSLDRCNNMKSFVKFIGEKAVFDNFDFKYAEGKLICEDGVINLKENKLLPFDKKLRGMPILKVHYNTKPLDYEAFKKTEFYGLLWRISNYNETWINAFQRVLGSALTGKTLKHFFVLYDGEGNTGKSTIINIVKEILGNELTHEDRGAFVSERNTYENVLYHTAELEGKRLITVGELKAGQRFREDILKQYTGNDTMSGRRPSGRVRNFVPCGNIILTGNEMSHFVALNKAFTDRMIIIPCFNPIDKDKADIYFQERVLANERDLIFKWLCDGANKVLNEGIVELSDWQREKQDEIDSKDYMLTFIKFAIEDVDMEKYTKDRLTADDVYSAFYSWAEKTNKKNLLGIQQSEFEKNLLKALKTHNELWVNSNLSKVKLKEIRPESNHINKWSHILWRKEFGDFLLK